ncbi:MAG: hypothetical protein FJ014_08245 [Chloroflexi bacterium]|nr:hypothetical protein [Chloroflexota bacterium]
MAKSLFRTELERRAWRTMLSFAIFRLESALTIAATIILTFLFPNPFPWWRWWYWLVLGVVAEALIIYTSLSDAALAQKVVADMLRGEFNPREFRSAKYRDKVAKALEYRERIEGVILRSREGVLRDHLQEDARRITEWVASVFGLARRLDAYENDEIIKRDMTSVKSAIEEFEARLRREDDEAVRQQMREAIHSKKTHWDNLQRLQNTMEKAEFQLENTLSAMGTVYAQLQLIGAKDVDSSRARRLREDIAAQVAALHDIVETMDEVYSGLKD